MEIALGHGLCACTDRKSTSFSEWIIDRTGGQTMLSFTCTMISTVNLARYGVFRVKDLGIWETCYNTH